MCGRDLKYASSLRLATLLIRHSSTVDDLDKLEKNKNLDALRVCFIDWSSGLVGLIDLQDKKRLGFTQSLEAIDEQLASGVVRIGSSDPWMKCHTSDKSSLVHVETAKKRHDILRPFIEVNEAQLFNRSGRHALILRIASSCSQTVVTIRSWIRAYYVGGMTTLALLPDYARCGAPGRPRLAGTRKLGRPTKNCLGKPVQPGFIVDETTAKKLHEGYKIFRLGREKMTLSDAYYHTMARYFSVGFERDPDTGKFVPKLKPAAERPTERQFIFWARKVHNSRNEAAHKLGRRKYEKDHRPVLGSARSGIIGPGQMYQVDATGGLVHLVSREDRGVRIGKAVVYVVVDTYSGLIVGYVTSLESASYAALMPALAHAFIPKHDGAGVEPNRAWPGGVVCETLLTDRGAEFLGENLENAALALGFDLAHAPPGRPDLKPLAERAFGYLKSSLRKLPGAAKELKEQGARDPEKDACLNLDELDEIVATVFENFNHGAEIRNHPDAIRLGDTRALPTPFNLWHYGLQEKSGGGRVYPPEEIKLALMPKETLSATSTGLKFKGLFYDSVLLREQGAFLRDTGHRRQCYLVAYDPRNLSTLSLLDRDGKVIELCPLTEKFSHLHGISLWEWEARKAHEKEISKALAEKRGKLKVAAHHAVGDIVSSARRESQMAGCNNPEFDPAAQAAEKGERRAEEAWPLGQTKPAIQTPGPGYVAQPSLTDELDDEPGEQG